MPATHRSPALFASFRAVNAALRGLCACFALGCAQRTIAATGEDGGAQTVGQAATGAAAAPAGGGNGGSVSCDVDRGCPSVDGGGDDDATTGISSGHSDAAEPDAASAGPAPEPYELLESCRARIALTPSAAMWTNAPPLGGYPHGTSLAVDATGRFTIATGFEGLLDLDGQKLDAKTGQYALLVAQYDASCKLRWARSYSAVYSWVAGAAVATSGDRVVLGGSFAGSVDFGKGPLFSPTNRNALLMSLDANGNTLWAKAFLASSSGHIYDVDVDANGDVFATGLFYESGDLGGGTLSTPPGGSGVAFLAKFSKDGTHLWSQSVPEAGTELELAVTAAGEAVVASEGNTEAFVAKFADDGARLWTSTLPRTEQMNLVPRVGLGVTPAGDALTAYQLGVNDPRVILRRLRGDTGEAEADVVLARTSQYFGYGDVVGDAAGNLLESGAFTESLGDPSSVGLMSHGFFDAFLFQRDRYGRLLAYAHLGSEEPDWPLGLVVGPAQEVLSATVTDLAPFTADLVVVRYVAPNL